MSGTNEIPESWSDVLSIQTPLICGILNVTPDSFSDGGKFIDKESISAKIKSLQNAGSNIIDVGGESTRPNAKAISEIEELERLSEVFELVNSGQFSQGLFSIDTRHSRTALLAIENGFHVINDVLHSISHVYLLLAMFSCY